MLWVHTPSFYALSFGDFGLRWYSLSYIITLIAVTLYIQKRCVSLDYTFKKKLFFDPFFTYLCMGVIIGGRLGHILLFDLAPYLQSPWKIFAIWEGGMSFHGGVLGVIIQSWYTSRRFPPLKLGFLLSEIGYITPLGLFLGRICNFLNGELVGVPTNASWGVIFSYYDMLPRHPSQLYEALSEGPLLWAFLYAMRTFARKRSDWDGAMHFTAGYSVMRFCAEFFREPDGVIGCLTFGQVYSITFLLIALITYKWYVSCTKVLKKH